MSTQPFRPPDPTVDGLIQATLEIANRDAAIRRKLKAALLAGEYSQAIQFASDLVGVKFVPKAVEDDIKAA
ncbi:hypothetical protein P8935_16340 [Telmatobacter sp. DSM 110680]|uniref:Uncharacterized protein n=1 Tax=Telmatobacter sp. DSM 110680 TaxID=3036704 RepID=A0AAU7DEI3_9BACT